MTLRTGLCEFVPALAQEGGAAGLFEGYASVFNGVDAYRDMILRGAFNATLGQWREKGRLPPLLWAHDPGALPLGRWLEMREDGRGLFVRGQFALETQPGREAHALVKMGALSGLSIGYRPVKARRDPTSGINRLSEIDLAEVSLVNRPADDAARVLSVKAAQVRRCAGRLFAPTAA